MTNMDTETSGVRYIPHSTVDSASTSISSQKRKPFHI